MPAENLSEKVSVNINTSTLSGIDLLVDHGYYSNRSDFINQALRAALQQQQSTLDRIISQYQPKDVPMKTQKKHWFMGVRVLTAADVEAMYQQGGGFTVSGYGMLVVEEEVDQEKLFAAVESISIKGKVSCTDETKEHYGIK